MPADVFKRRMMEDSSMLVFDVRNVRNLIKKAREYQKIIVVFHIATAVDLQTLIEILEGLSEPLAKKSAYVIVISGAHYSNLKKTLAKYDTIEVVANSIQVTDLQEKAMERYKNLTGEPAASDETRPVVLVKSDKVSPPNTENQPPQKVKPAPVIGLPKMDPFAGKAGAFTPVENSRETASLVKECIESSTHAVLFNERLSNQVTVRFNTFDKSTKVISATITKGKVQDLVEHTQKNGDGLLVNFNLKRCRVFFQSKTFQVRDENEVEIGVPEVIYDVQRRLHLRLRVNDLAINVTDSTNALVSLKAYDISAGGLCLQIPGSVAEAWGKGSSRPTSVRFDLGERSISVDNIRVTYIKPDENNPGSFLAGIQFNNISNRDQLIVNMYVYRESFDYVKSVLG